jgi:uncharacterized membrane protein
MSVGAADVLAPPLARLSLGAGRASVRLALWNFVLPFTSFKANPFVCVACRNVEGGTGGGFSQGGGNSYSSGSNGGYRGTSNKPAGDWPF